ALVREPLDLAPPRIAEAEELRRLVERLSGRVVARRPEEGVPVVLARPIERGMSAGHDEAEERTLDRAVELDREEVSFDVIDADEGKTARPRDRLRRTEADEQRADEAGTAGRGDAFDVAETDSRLLE